MDLRLALALGLAGGLAVTAAPALGAKATVKNPRDRLAAQAPTDDVQTPIQTWPKMEDFAPGTYDSDRPRRPRRVGNP